MGVIAGILCVWLCIRFLSACFRPVATGINAAKKSEQRNKALRALRDVERAAGEVEKQLAKVEDELRCPMNCNVTVTGAEKIHSMTINGVDIPIRNAMNLTHKEFMEQEKRIAMVEKAAREKQRFEWEQEKMEWARQREQERKAEAERKRAERERAEREKAAREADEKQLKKRLADRDAIHSAEMVNDLYGAMYAEIEQLKNGATAPKEKVRLLNSQAALLNRIHREQQNIEKAKYTKYRCGV